MSGIFGTRALLVTDLNLLLQIVVLIILFVGLKFGRTKTKDSLRTHGRLMTLMVILNLVGTLTVMIPSFVLSFSYVLEEQSRLGFPLISVHALFGAIATILGITLVFKKFGNVRLWMRFTITVWLITLVLGFFIYLVYYVF